MVVVKRPTRGWRGGGGRYVTPAYTALSRQTDWAQCAVPHRSLKQGGAIRQDKARIYFL